MRLKDVNALGLPPYLILFQHFIQLTVDKYDAVQQLYKCKLCPKIQDIGAIAPVWVSNISHKRYHTSAEYVRMLRVQMWFYTTVQ